MSVRSLPILSSLSLSLLLSTFSAFGQTPPPNLEIHDIQGVKSTTAATVSPYVGQKVATTGVVTAVPGGELLKIKVKETIYHPGHFRVALAVLDRSELPADPEDMTRDTPHGPMSVSGKVDPNPKPPVIMDGIFDHHVFVAHKEFETEVHIPNINCDHCTLQVIQFMEEHPVNKDGRFTYHHCADLKVTANPHLPIDRAWPGQAKAKKMKSGS